MSRQTRTAVALLLVFLVGGGIGWWTLSSEPTANDAPDPHRSAETTGDDDKPNPVDDVGPMVSLFLEVHNADGQPIGGTLVQLKGRLGMTSQFTEERLVGEDGLATFENVPASIHEVRLSARGYQVASLPPPHLPAGQKEGSFTFVMQRKVDDAATSGVTTVDDADAAAIPFSGVVLSADGPVRNAQVLRLREDMQGMDPGDVVAADKSGRFLFRPSPLADEKNPVVGVIAFHPSYGQASVEGKPLQPTSAKVGTEVSITLPLGAYIEGEVLAPMGGPQGEFTLFARPHVFRNNRLLGRAERMLRHLSTKERRQPGVQMAIQVFRHMRKGVRLWVKDPDAVDENDDQDDNDKNKDKDKDKDKDNVLPRGRFRIGPVAAGVMTLIAASEDHAPVERELEVAAGETLQGVRLQLQAPLVVSGVVTDDKGAPLQGVRVRARSTQGEPVPGFAVGRTDADGAYSIRTRADQRHTVSLSKRGYTPFDQGGVEGGAGDEVIVDAQLRKAPRRKGKKGRRRAAPRDYVGIGAQLRKDKEGRVVVQRLFPGGAAAEQLAEGDVIVAIDREDATGGLRDVVQLILGEPDTEVELTILPGGEGPEENVVLMRRRVSTGG